MSNKRVIVTYSGDTHLDIDEEAIVDAFDLDADLDDAAIEAAIRKDIEAYMEHGSDVQPVDHSYGYDRVDLIASVRAEIVRRKQQIAADFAADTTGA